MQRLDPNSATTTTVAVRLTAQQLADVDAAARFHGITRSTFIRDAAVSDAAAILGTTKPRKRRRTK